MKILVAVKRVVDFNVRVHVKPDGSGVALEGVKMAINPFDEIAVEEAVRMKEKGVATEVVAVTIGADAAQEQLRHAMALGADRAIQVSVNEKIEPLVAAQLLAAVVKQESPQMVILGKQAIDDDCNQTGQMLAALLGWPQATFASKIVLENSEAVVTREVDGGLMTIAVAMPCIVTTDLRLNEPRYATLPNIMKARGKPIAKLTPEQLGVAIASKLQVLKVEAPAKRKGGIKVGTVEELVEKLKNEARVL